MAAKDSSTPAHLRTSSFSFTWFRIKFAPVVNRLHYSSPRPLRNVVCIYTSLVFDLGLVFLFLLCLTLLFTWPYFCLILFWITFVGFVLKAPVCGNEKYSPQCYTTSTSLTYWQEAGWVQEVMPNSDSSEIDTDHTRWSCFLSLTVQIRLGAHWSLRFQFLAVRSGTRCGFDFGLSVPRCFSALRG